MKVSQPKFSFNLLGVKPFLLALALVLSLSAQDPFSDMTPAVARVGDRLACRCQGCKFTVGNCNMPRCSYSDGKRRQIAQMQAQGMSDDAIVSRFVQEEGVVTLSAPPAGTLGGIVAWIMPGLALLIGFWVYLRFVRRNQQPQALPTAQEQAAMEKFRSQIDRDFDEPLPSRPPDAK